MLGLSACWEGVLRHVSKFSHMPACMHVGSPDQGHRTLTNMCLQGPNCSMPCHGPTWSFKARCNVQQYLALLTNLCVQEPNLTIASPLSQGGDLCLILGDD